MSSNRGQRIQSNCRAIWGEGDYEIDVETVDWTHYMAFVRKDFGLSFGPVLIFTGMCYSSDHAERELDRKLGAWARQKQSGRPITKAQVQEVLGGPERQNHAIAGIVCDVLEQIEAQRRAAESRSKKAQEPPSSTPRKADE